MGDYAALRPLIDEDVFLSDFGFGGEPDPAGRWEEMGSQPLETMDVLLHMQHVVRKRTKGLSTSGPPTTPTPTRATSRLATRTSSPR